jgi:chromosomal replication initiation ATPase DnaA
MVKVANSLRRGPLVWRPNDTKLALARLRRTDPVALAVVSLVAETRGVALADLLRTTRSRAHIAAARQLAMYLVNVKLGRTMTEIGILFGRDRTTVSYACRMVEDLREGAFDRDIENLEAAIDELDVDTDTEAGEPFHAVAC